MSKQQLIDEALQELLLAHMELSNVRLSMGVAERKVQKALVAVQLAAEAPVDVQAAVAQAQPRAVVKPPVTESIEAQTLARSDSGSSDLRERIQATVDAAAQTHPTPQVAPTQQPSAEFTAAMAAGVPQRGPRTQMPVAGGPTEEGVPAAPAPEPTPEPVKSKEEIEEENRRSYLPHFFGTGSIFSRTLSPEVMTNAKGLIAPNFVEAVKQYNEDAVRSQPERVMNWPTGFYRDEQTKTHQFFANTNKALVAITGLPGSTGVHVALKPISPQTQWQPIETLPLYELVKLREELESNLMALGMQG